MYLVFRHSLAPGQNPRLFQNCIRCLPEVAGFDSPSTTSSSRSQVPSPFVTDFSHPTMTRLYFLNGLCQRFRGKPDRPTPWTEKPILPPFPIFRPPLFSRSPDRMSELLVPLFLGKRCKPSLSSPPFAPFLRRSFPPLLTQHADVIFTPLVGLSLLLAGPRSYPLVSPYDFALWPSAHRVPSSSSLLRYSGSVGFFPNSFPSPHFLRFTECFNVPSTPSPFATPVANSVSLCLMFGPSLARYLPSDFLDASSKSAVVGSVEMAAFSLTSSF